MAATTALRYGGWLPKSPNVHKAFFDEHIKLARDRINRGVPHEPCIGEFEDRIKNDPIMSFLFTKIFNQISPMNRIANFDELLYMMDDIVIAAPKYQITEDGEGEPIGVPMYLLFDLLSNTDAGHDLFRMDAFNDAMKAVLDNWGSYLKTTASNDTLTDAADGWFGEKGLADLESDDRGEFNATYDVPDPDAVNRGYTSWDQFFTRALKEDARPIDEPTNKYLIHNACESTVYRIAYDVKKHDQFWLKGQAYSLYDMLGGADSDPGHVDELAGGTVYQAFLSPQDYHRWHSPIDGVIEKAVVIPGTYYATLTDDGAPAPDPDLPEQDPGLPEHDPRGALIRSQAWLTVAAARALVFIRSDDAAIGLVCFIGVGMVEVSTCELSVEQGAVVKAGDALGMFRFGGSTHALVFGPQIKVSFEKDVIVGNHVKVNAKLADISPA